MAARSPPSAARSVQRRAWTASFFRPGLAVLVELAEVELGRGVALVGELRACRRLRPLLAAPRPGDGGGVGGRPDRARPGASAFGASARAAIGAAVAGARGGLRRRRSPRTMARTSATRLGSLPPGCAFEHHEPAGREADRGQQAGDHQRAGEPLRRALRGRPKARPSARRRRVGAAGRAERSARSGAARSILARRGGPAARARSMPLRAVLSAAPRSRSGRPRATGAERRVAGARPRRSASAARGGGTASARTRRSAAGGLGDDGRLGRDGGGRRAGGRRRRASPRRTRRPCRSRRWAPARRSRDLDLGAGRGGESTDAGSASVGAVRPKGRRPGRGGVEIRGVEGRGSRTAAGAATGGEGGRRRGAGEAVARPAAAPRRPGTARRRTGRRSVSS